MKKQRLIAKQLTLILLGMLVFGPVHSQPKSDDTELEALYDRFESEEDAKLQAPADSKAEPKQTKDVGSISDLVAPFEDIAVIQRRFLPRSQRFEMSALGLVTTNNQFFNNFGLGLKGSYYFHEKYGVELSYLYLTSSEKDVTEGLKDQQIQTASLVEPEGYMGVAFKWSPFYGKIAWFQEKIIPFDIYFTPGIGLTKTALGESEPTFSLGMGQSFAISKASAIRWDLNWNFYQATVRFTTGDETQAQNDMILMIGYSYYIPEATYR